MGRKNATAEMMKAYMAESLFILMRKTRYEKITIDAITDKAGVNRSTYYRNFNAKEEIVKFYISQIMDAYLEKYEAGDSRGMKKYLYTLFEHFYARKQELLAIYKNNLSYLLLETINERFRARYQPQKTDNRAQHIIYFHIGGIYNQFLLWFQHGMRETPAEMTEISLSVLPDGTRPFLAASGLWAEFITPDWTFEN